MNVYGASIIYYLMIFIAIIFVIRAIRSKNMPSVLWSLLILFIFIYFIFGSMMLKKENDEKYVEILENIKTLYVLDGRFYPIKYSMSKNSYRYPWFFARVDLNLSNNSWENDAKQVLVKNGWTKHKTDKNSLCKNGIKATFQQANHKNKNYEIVTMLYDNYTKSENECDYQHNEFLNWLR